MSILDISKIAMYDYWYDYVKPKYGRKSKIYYTDKNRKTFTQNFLKVLKIDSVNLIIELADHYP